MKSLLFALSFMTRLPIPTVVVNDLKFARAIRWFPLAGVLVGIVVALAAWAGMHRDSWTGALLALVAWVAVTGALHLDGLGDIADAAGATHQDRSRLHEVLADPHIGSFGVTAIIVQLLVKLVALHEWLVNRPWWTLVLVAFMARIAPLYWARLPSLHTGIASRFRDGAAGWVLVLWCALAAGTSIALMLPLLVAFPGALMWGWWIERRFGGISGDGHGAGIECLESLMLLAGALSGTLA